MGDTPQSPGGAPRSGLPANVQGGSAYVHSTAEDNDPPRSHWGWGLNGHWASSSHTSESAPQTPARSPDHRGIPGPCQALHPSATGRVEGVALSLPQTPTPLHVPCPTPSSPLPLPPGPEPELMYFCHGSDCGRYLIKLANYSNCTVPFIPAAPDSRGWVCRKLSALPLPPRRGGRLGRLPSQGRVAEWQGDQQGWQGRLQSGLSNKPGPTQPKAAAVPICKPRDHLAL